MGRVDRIWVKRAHGGPMDARPAVQLVAGRGVAGSADQGGKRQVTILSRERWTAACESLGQALDSRERRANLLVSGIDLEDTRGRVLVLGACRVRILGETKPCEQMDDAFTGLRDALRPHWGGGAYGEVLDGGEVAVGDEVRWE
jgi:MOSC domain-containing protein YiiM